MRAKKQEARVMAYLKLYKTINLERSAILCN